MFDSVTASQHIRRECRVKVSFTANNQFFFLLLFWNNGISTRFYLDLFRRKIAQIENKREMFVSTGPFQGEIWRQKEQDERPDRSAEESFFWATGFCVSGSKKKNIRLEFTIGAPFLFGFWRP